MKRFILSTLFFIALLSIWHLLVLAKVWSVVLLPDPMSVWEYLKGAAGDGTLVQAWVRPPLIQHLQRHHFVAKSNTARF